MARFIRNKCLWGFIVADLMPYMYGHLNNVLKESPTVRLWFGWLNHVFSCYLSLNLLIMIILDLIV